MTRMLLLTVALFATGCSVSTSLYVERDCPDYKAGARCEMRHDIMPPRGR